MIKNPQSIISNFVGAVARHNNLRTLAVDDSDKTFIEATMDLVTAKLLLEGIGAKIELTTDTYESVTSSRYSDNDYTFTLDLISSITINYNNTEYKYMDDHLIWDTRQPYVKKL